ncbi:MAG: hypothetical protein E7307_02240 [Butyrivibrio sp.]|nr:hypothetical protein [Butyrivibrio sp.]
MEERRKIGRVEFSANSVIVDRNTLEKYYGHVKNISPLGVAVTMDEGTPSLLGRDVILVAETMIMYADCIREDNDGGQKTVAFCSKKFTNDVLQYLFDRIGSEETI